MNVYSKKQSIQKQKKKYLLFISMILMSVVLGFFFYFIISDGNKDLVSSIQQDFFQSIKEHHIIYLKSLFNSIFSNSLYIILIFVLGLSVIGIVFIIGIVLFKSFILGFSISSIIGTFGWKGVILSFFYVFPHQVFFLIILLLMCFHSCNFCCRLFKHLFMKNIINFKIISRKYVKVFLFSMLCALMCSIYEVFIMQYLIRLVL